MPAEMTLAPNGAFVWTGPLEEYSANPFLIGWCRTTAAPPGLVRCYTGDLRGQPTHNPFAALHLFDLADESAKQALAPHKAEYEASFRLEPDGLPLPMPPGERLLPFQAAGVEYALRRQNAMIGDPMGLGKSIQALAVCNARRAERILILCPAAVVPQWVKYVRRWLISRRPNYPDIVYRVTGMRPPPATARVVIASYDTAKNEQRAAMLAAESWDHVILDEAHYLRNHTAIRTKATLGGYGGAAARKYPGIVSKAAHILALTGTPLPNRPREAYTLARALDWESVDLMSEAAFQERFNPSFLLRLERRDGSVVFIPKEGTHRLPELQARLRCGFMVRREKKAAAPQLPQKIYDVVLVDSDATRKVVRAERALDLDVDKLDSIPPRVHGRLSTLRKEMALAMLPTVAEYVSEILASEGGKVVVFAHHIELIQRLGDELAKARPVVVTGATPPQGRAMAADAFRTNPLCRVFIGQIQAAGTGVDGLQEVCSTAIFAEPSWVPAENEQAVDRLHRIGQAEPVLVRFLVAEGSLNARIITRYVEKSRVAHVALDDRA